MNVRCGSISRAIASADCCHSFHITEQNSPRANDTFKLFIHWDPSKLTYVNEYSYEDRELSSSQYLWNVSIHQDPADSLKRVVSVAEFFAVYCMTCMRIALIEPSIAHFSLSFIPKITSTIFWIQCIKLTINRYKLILDKMNNKGEINCNTFQL